MSYTFNPHRDTPIKRACWNHLKDNPEAKRFLNWCQHLVIVSKDSGAIPFTPDTWFGSQWMFLDTLFNSPPEIRHFIILKGRQQGISTICNAYDLYFNFRHFQVQSSLVTADYQIAEGMKTNLRTMYQNLPLSAKRLKKYDNSYQMSFKNGSTIRYLFTTAKKSKKGNMGRSGSCNYAHFTEVAFFQNVDDLNAFMATLSDEHPYRLYIYESTANGFNHFFDMWESAKESNTKRALFLGWWSKETYQITEPLDLEKYGYPLEAWEQEQWNMVKDMYGFEITMSQIAWWRKKMKEDMQDRGGLTKEDMMLQENPWTEYDAFRLSGKSFFKSAQARKLEEEANAPTIRYTPIIRQKEEEMEFKESPIGKLLIWEKYDPFAQYLLGADPSFGANPESDNGVITIYKCFKDCIEQVAEFADNYVDQKAFTWIMLSMAGMYNAPQILEVTGPGNTVLHLIDLYRRWIRENKISDKMTIYDYAKKYRTEYLYKRVDSLGSGCARHWKTTGESKETMMFNFQTSINNGEMLVRSKDLIKEMEYVIHDGNSINAIEGKHDDRVIASALACQYWIEAFRSRLQTKAEYEKIKASMAEEDRLRREHPEKVFGRSFMKDMVLSGRN